MKKYRISTKLSATYAILVVILIGVALIIFYHFNKQNLYEEGVSNLSQIADATMVQVDNRLTNMEQVAVDVLTDIEFLKAWETAQNSETKENEKAVRRILTAAYVNRTDIRRVAIFDESGYFISTGQVNTNREAVSKRASEITGGDSLGQVNSRIFLKLHQDSWNRKAPGSVISEIKPIKNSKKEIIGYIEIQQNAFYLKNICDLKWNGSTLNSIVFMGDEDELFYTNFDVASYSGDYVDFFQGLTRQYSKIRETDKYIVATATSNYYSGKMVFILEKSILYKSMQSLLQGVLISAGLLIIFTIIYILVVTKVIMRPINTFIKRMKETDIHNFMEHQDYKNMDYETGILVKGLNEMAYRLQRALDQQKKLEEVQTKTLFSILQSEISPHFLYNTMGSIANMCEQGETQEAADACYNLTDILRYASNYATVEVTVHEEVENLKCYLEIMKSRYRQRLHYELRVDEDIEDVMIPKLILQPIVENAIKYSLLERDQVIIKVFGVTIGENLIFEIKDNGCGISQEASRLVEERVGAFSNSEESEEIIKSIQNGGLGLTGTLIRLAIFFADRFTYQFLNNNDEGGTSILLCISKGRQ